MVVRLSALPAGRPLPPGRFLVLISIRGLVYPKTIVQLEELGKLKYPVTSLGIEAATFRHVAWCLNQLRYRVPHIQVDARGKIKLILILQWFSAK
jgi:hypothetical protein